MTVHIKHIQKELEQTPQDSLWHGEGNVWKHTEMVCEALESIPEYQESDEQVKRTLHLAAVFHDIGKISATQMENGHWTAHGHAKISARMSRQLLWQNYGYCGTAETLQFREAIAGLVQYHSLPVHAIDDNDGKRRLMRFASNGELVPSLTVKNLCTLAKADILGRICPDQQALLEKVELCAELAKEAGCYEVPYNFPSNHTLYHYLAKERISSAEHPIYDDTWGEVILLSGLPGTGKDTWIQKHCPELPVVSLDNIRKEIKIAPWENQSKVIDEGRARAKAYLRQKRSFIWNATDLSPMVRNKQIDLFSRYGASVRLVYLETSWEERIHRNQNRSDAVPERAVCKMLNTLIPPERFEAQKVEWICV